MTEFHGTDHGLRLGDAIKVTHADGSTETVRISCATSASSFRARPPRWYDRIVLIWLRVTAWWHA